MAPLPVLQDDAVAGAWENWEAEWRDVFALDADNETRAVYNLTINDLSDPERRETLKAMLVAAASD